MTEVIRVSKDRPAREAIDREAIDREATEDDTGQSHSDRPPTEVIRVGPARKPAEPESPRTAHVASGPRQPGEVIKVGSPHQAAGSITPTADHTDSKSVQAAKVAKAVSQDLDQRASSTKPGQPHREIAALAELFSDSLKALDLVASEQAKWLVGIAVDLAAAARSTGLTASTSALAGDSYTNGEAETLVTALKRTAETQMKALTAAQGRLSDMAADREADSTRPGPSISVRDSAAPLDAALANMVSNLNVAQQNAVANQQAMNSIAQAAIAAGLNLLYTRSGSHESDET